MRQEARKQESHDEVRAAGLPQRGAKVAGKERRLERIARKEGPREREGYARRRKGNRADGRRERHVRLLPRGDPAHERRLVARLAQCEKVQLRPQAVAREARPGKARNEKDGFHAGGRARCQRDGARSARPAACAHIESEEAASRTLTAGTSGG